MKDKLTADNVKVNVCLEKLNVTVMPYQKEKQSTFLLTLPDEYYSIFYIVDSQKIKFKQKKPSGKWGNFTHMQICV
jgi:hypothetical protein